MVIVLVDVVLTCLQKVKTVIAHLVILHRPDESLVPVHIKCFRLQRIVVQRVDCLLLIEVEEAVLVKVNIFGAPELHLGQGLKPTEVRNVAPVVAYPHGLLDVELVVHVVQDRPYVEAECC